MLLELFSLFYKTVRMTETHSWRLFCCTQVVQLFKREGVGNGLQPDRWAPTHSYRIIHLNRPFISSVTALAHAVWGSAWTTISSLLPSLKANTPILLLNIKIINLWTQKLLYLLVEANRPEKKGGNHTLIDHRLM